jgi:hypothetical protein
MLNTAIAFSTVLTAILGMVQVPAQDQSAGVSLAKTGFLGFGVEPGFILKGILLDRPSVLKELKVTDAQKARLKQALLESDRLAARSGQETRAIKAELKARGDVQGLAEFNQSHAILVRALTLDCERPIMAVLDSRQRARFEQLQLQADGPSAFLRPQIQVRLNMSPEQIDVIKAIYERSRQAIVESATLPPDTKPIAFGLTVEKRAEMLKSKEFGKRVENVRSRVVLARDATMREIAENLTKKQRATYLKMLGEKFEFPTTIEPRELGVTELPKKAPSGRDENKDPADRSIPQ